jgi:hypothetical protein
VPEIVHDLSVQIRAHCVCVLLLLHWHFLVLTKDEHMESEQWLVMVQVQDVTSLGGLVSRRHVPVKHFSTGATAFVLSTLCALKVCPSHHVKCRV